MENSAIKFFIKNILIPLPGIFFLWYIINDYTQYSWWIYYYMAYVLAIIPIWLIAVNTKNISNGTWKTFFLKYALLSLIECFYIYSWPIGTFFSTTVTDYKMILLLLLFVSILINLLLLLIFIIIKILTARK